MMGLSRDRILTLFIAIAIACGNAITIIIFSRLPDDGYHLARGAICYLCGAAIISVLGVVGACMENGLAVSIFGVCLLVDALLSTIPRMVIPIFALSRAPELCLPPDSLAYRPGSSQYMSDGVRAAKIQSFIDNPGGNLLGRSQGIPIWSRKIEEGFSLSDCLGISTLAEITICILALTAAVLQIRSAILVRNYGQRLNTKRRRDAIHAKVVELPTADVELTVELTDDEAHGDALDEETEPHVARRPRASSGRSRCDV